jgi:hypothetical protein
MFYVYSVTVILMQLLYKRFVVVRTLAVCNRYVLLRAFVFDALFAFVKSLLVHGHALDSNCSVLRSLATYLYLNNTE